MKMRRLRWWERLRMLVDRRYRQRYKQDLDEVMRWLMEHPEEPVEFDE